VLFQEVGEKEQFEHNKDYEELDEDYSPECPSKCHRAEAFIIEVEDAVYQAIPFHRLNGFREQIQYFGANIYKICEVAKGLRRFFLIFCFLV
jgi:hypothetical protein